MSEVDHVLAATTALYYANEYRNPEDSSSAQLQALAEAQVHATLALVEEQRTANLLAFLRLARDRGGVDAATEALEQQVRGRLGVDS